MSIVQQLIIYGFIFAVLLWWLFMVEYRQYATDQLRHRLFCIRDNLFQEAHQHQFFHTHAYGLTRTTLNGMIRFAHNMSFLQFVVFMILHRFMPDRSAARAYLQRLGEALHDVPLETRKRILAAHNQMHAVVLLHMLKTSLLTGPLFLATFWLLRAVHVARRFRTRLIDNKRFRRRWAMLDARAYDIGEDSQAAA